MIPGALLPPSRDGFGARFAGPVLHTPSRSPGYRHGELRGQRFGLAVPGRIEFALANGPAWRGVPKEVLEIPSLVTQV
jgi:hypothetical protein